MNLTIWIATGLLAAVALLGGITKGLLPKEKLERMAEHESANGSGTPATASSGPWGFWSCWPRPA